MPLTFATALTWAREQLDTSDSPLLDAQILLCHATGATRTTLIAWPERTLSDDQQRLFESLIDKRRTGHPIAHIIGEREFWSLPLTVTPDTLVPRPDTELLVEVALGLLKGLSKPVIADLGTGTGAIALALGSERPDANIIATDRSQQALDVARSNARKLSLSNVEFALGNWYDALSANGSFDLIVSNPPYIRSDDPHLLEGDVRFEPEQALVSGTSGLDDIKILVHGGRDYLRKGGWLLLEHGYDQAEAVQDLLSDAGYEEVASRRDLGENLRASFGRVPLQ